MRRARRFPGYLLQPKDQSEGAHRRPTVILYEGSFSGYPTGPADPKQYAIVDELAPQLHIPIRAQRVGAYVIIVPRRPLRPKRWYRVDFARNPGPPRFAVSYGRFRTGMLDLLARPTKSLIVEVSQVGPRDSSSACEYRSPTVTLRVTRNALSPVELQHFVWILEVARKGRFQPFSAFVGAHREVRDGKLGIYPRYRFSVGSSQCGRGPELTPGKRYRLRMVLVRSDGLRLETPAIDLTLSKLPKEPGHNRMFPSIYP